MASASTAALVDALRQARLLEEGQFDEVTRTLAALFPDPEALAAELIRRGWLTPFQADMLLRGRGQDLSLGSYVLSRKLGEGGMGQVFQARHRTMGRVVALKLIRPERLANPDAVRRFEREVRAAAALSHPNIVHAYDADRIGGTHLLVMEYVEGAADLAGLVRRGGPLPIAQAADCVRQVALGLQHAHERGMVHRDIKPHNLLLAANGAVKILDMGLARLAASASDEQSATMTREGAVMGTPDYIAPEQAMESHTVDIRADLYSLGCTLYFLLAGRAPFGSGSLMEKLLKHRLEEPTPIEQVRPGVPAGLAAVVRKLMAKKPEDRYQTPAEVAAALAALPPAAAEDRTIAEADAGAASADTLAAGWEVVARRDDTSLVESSPRRRRQAEEWRLLSYAVLGCAVLLAGVAGLWFLLKPKADQAKQAQKGDAGNVNVPERPKPGVHPAWLKHVAELPVSAQAEAVAAKLVELNPGFEGKTTHNVEGATVTELAFLSDEVTDITPLRALPRLKILRCNGSAHGKGKLSDLSPLKGMKLTTLLVQYTRVANLSPLGGMPLTHLNCHQTPVAELSPLKGMPLKTLILMGTGVSDLSPLEGMPLAILNVTGTKVSDLSALKKLPLLWSFHCNFTPVADLSALKGLKLVSLGCVGTRVSDLSPLRGMELRELQIDSTNVSDLSPLEGMPLWAFSCQNTRVTDLSLLKKMPLTHLGCDFVPERDGEILRSMKTLTRVNDKPAEEFFDTARPKKP